MKLFAGATVTLMLVLVPCQTVLAQSAAMPLPNLVVKDADGKAIAAISPVYLVTGSPHPWIALNVNETLAVLQVNFEKSQIRRGVVFFLGTGCTGDPYMYPPGSQYWWDIYTQTNFGVVGPDPTTGTYRLFRTTSTTGSATFPLSKWDYDNGEFGGCIAESGQFVLSPAEEVLPDPFEGFHGPTSTNPERVLTVGGGTKLP